MGKGNAGGQSFTDCARSLSLCLVKKWWLAVNILFLEMFPCSTPKFLKADQPDQFTSKDCFSSFLEKEKHTSSVLIVLEKGAFSNALPGYQEKKRNLQRPKGREIGRFMN